MTETIRLPLRGTRGGEEVVARRIAEATFVTLDDSAIAIDDDVGRDNLDVVRLRDGIAVFDGRERQPMLGQVRNGIRAIVDVNREQGDVGFILKRVVQDLHVGR